MIRPIAATLSLAALAASASAQSFTSPRGFAGVEGDSGHFVLFSPQWERFMQIDDTARGQAVANLTSMAFRQDSSSINRGASGGRAHVTVRLGESNFGSIGPVFDQNWFGTPTVVHGTRQLDLPDWSLQPQSTPAPWSLRLPFDRPWSFSGDHALAFEIVTLLVTASDGPSLDRELGAPSSFNFAYGTPGPAGCVLPGNALAMTHDIELRNHGPSHPNFGMRFLIGLQRAPVGQPALANFALTDAALAVPGLCGTLHAAPVVSVPLGQTDGLGDVLPAAIDIPYVAAAEGVRLVTQVFSAWPGAAGLPIAASNPCSVVMPGAPRPSPATAYLYAASAASATAPLWRDRGVIVEFSR